MLEYLFGRILFMKLNNKLMLGFQENQPFLHVMLGTINSCTLLVTWNGWRSGWLWVKSHYASVSSSCAQPPQPPPPPGLLRGVCPPCQSRGICKFCAARGPGYSWAFDTHMVSYQNITTQGILLEKKQIGSTVKDRGLFSILCIHFFIAYQARITLRNLGTINMNQRCLVSESNFCWYYLKNILSYL